MRLVVIVTVAVSALLWASFSWERCQAVGGKFNVWGCETFPVVDDLSVRRPKRALKGTDKFDP